METIIGSFEARKANQLSGDVLYSVTVTSERLVAVRVGGQLAAEGSNAALAHFGLLGVLIGLFLRKSGEKKRETARKEQEQFSLDEMLQRHPKNFELRNAQIVKAALKRIRFTMHGPAVAELTLLQDGAPPLALLLPSSEKLASCVKALRAVMPDRLEVPVALGPLLAAQAKRARLAAA